MKRRSSLETFIAIITFALFTILILWGNIVAGFGAGLGCPDWPLCHGEVIPKFKTYEVALEYIHRILAALAFFSLLWLTYLRFRRVLGWERFLTLIPLLFLLFQILLGGVVVVLELPASLTVLHFALALLLYGFVFLFLRFQELPRLSLVPLLLYFLFFFQSLLGAIVRHYKAGLSCPDFPTCLGYWIPPTRDPGVILHLLHRFTAYGIFLFLLGLLLASTRATSLKPYRLPLLHFLGGILLQIGIGVGILHTRLNPWVIMAHALFALGFLVLSLELLKITPHFTPSKEIEKIYN